MTIGSFDQVGERLANGQLAPTPEVQQIIQKFGAAYDTPADPLTGDDIRKQRRAEELKQQFTQMLNSHDAQVAAGMNPKHVKIMSGKKVERIIPIDVYPHAIEVPQAERLGGVRGPAIGGQARGCRCSSRCRTICVYPASCHAGLDASIRDLVIGTHNRKKGLELAELLAPWGFHVVTLEDVPDAIEVVEDGDSFAANAALKATQQAKHLGRWVLADDSGLEVDALGGAPGIYSARFAGPNATDADNNRLLLGEARRSAAGAPHGPLCVPRDGGRSDGRGAGREPRHLPRADSLRLGRHQRLRLRPVLRSGRIPPHVRRARPDGEANAQPPLAGPAGDSAAAAGARVGWTIVRAVDADKIARLTLQLKSPAGTDECQTGSMREGRMNMRSILPLAT